MKKLLLVLLFVPLVISCSKDDESTISNKSLIGTWNFTSWKEVNGWNDNMQEENNFFNVLSNCDLNSYVILTENKAELFSYSDVCQIECRLAYLGDYTISINSSTINFKYDFWNTYYDCYPNFNENATSYDAEFYEGVYRYEISGNNLKLMFNNEDAPGELWTDVITLKRN